MKQLYIRAVVKAAGIFLITLYLLGFRAVPASAVIIIEKPTLSVAVTGGGAVVSDVGGIDCGIACSQQLDFGTPVVLTASASSGYVFSSWGGACTGNLTTCSLTLTSNTSVTALFVNNECVEGCESANADLAVTKTADVSVVSPGGTVTYTISVGNSGPQDATDVTVTDVLDGSFSVTQATASQGTFNPSSGTWNVGSVPVNSTSTLALVVAVSSTTESSVIKNSASVNGGQSQSDSNTANNTASVDVQVSSLLVIGGETIKETTANSVNITWTTNHPATSRVVYDIIPHSTLAGDANYGYALTTGENSAMVVSHSVVVSNLNPGTMYFFRPVSHGSPEVTGQQVYTTTLTGSTGGGGGGGGCIFFCGPPAPTLTTPPAAAPPSAAVPPAFGGLTNTAGTVLGISTTQSLAVPQVESATYPNSLPRTGIPGWFSLLLLLSPTALVLFGTRRKI